MTNLTTSALRKCVKAAAPTASVAPYGDRSWTIRVRSFSEVDLGIAAAGTLGCRVRTQRRNSDRASIEIEGTRWAPEWVVVVDAGDP